jgi:Zn-dependent protease
LNPSWFIIFILITWALAGSYFPTTYPAWTFTEKIAAGVITSLLFFSSVLAHELMHSVVAQREGITVKSITLFIFGGVSEIAGEPKKPADEFRMALAGPLTSLVLGAALFGLWLGLKNTSGAGQFVGAIAYWLGIINLSLGAFNLVPGFPLDGGRVLRSILWWRSGDLRGATKTAASIGRVVAYLFIFGGIFMVFTPGWLVNGIWFIFIGWFLDNAAVGSYRQVQLNDLLAGHKVSEAMTRDCVSVPPQMTADHMISEYALTKGQQCFPVSFDSLRNVAREARKDKTAQQIMTPLSKLKWVSPSDDLTRVLAIMTEDDVAQVPVVEDNKVVGLISREKLLSFIDLQANLGK